MAITLGGLALPRGLRWVDEFDWSAREQSISRSLSGAQLIQYATRQGGRPITLLGGLAFTRLTRAELLALRALLEDAPEDGLLLQLHDGRRYQTAPLYADAGPLLAYPVPLVLGAGPADPQPQTLYWIDQIRLMELAT